MSTNKRCKCTEKFDDVRQVCTGCGLSKIDLKESAQSAETVKVAEPDQAFREAVLDKNNPIWKEVQL